MSNNKMIDQEQIIEWARDAGFNCCNGFSPLVVRHSNGSWVDVEAELVHFAAIAYAAGAESEKAARRAAQAEQERLKGILVKSNSERIQAYQQGQRDMRDANARLIAAAPDLLEALKAILGANCSAAHNAAIHRAQDAVDKATGEKT